MHTIFNTPARRIGWAGSLAAAVIVVFLVIGIGPAGNGTSVAFAMVAKKMRNVDRMSYTHMSTDRRGTIINLLEISYKEPGFFRQDSENQWFVVDHSTREGINVYHWDKTYAIVDYWPGPAKSSSHIEMFRNLPDQADEDLGLKRIDGQLLQGFAIHDENGYETTIWVDPETSLPARLETIPPKEMGGKLVLKDFQYDVPDERFTLEPPEGYTEKARRPPPTEQDLIEFLRFWIDTDPNQEFPPFVSWELTKLVGERKSSTTGFANLIPDGLLFLLRMTVKPECDFQYVGKGVQLDQSGQPVCWWRPDGAENYRVLFADLSVIDLAPERLREHFGHLREELD